MANLSCGVQCTRILLFVVNLIFLTLSCLLLAFGIYINLTKNLNVELPGHEKISIQGLEAFRSISIVIISIAVFAILLSIFGCLGAAFKNRAFLYIHAVVLILIVIFQIAAAIIILSYRGEICKSYYSGFHEFFMETYSNNHTDLKSVIESIENNFKCCGAYNVTDYTRHNFTIPAACHENQDIHKPIFHDGCAHKIVTWLSNQFPIVGGIAGGIFLIEIFSIISSIGLGIAISHSSREKFIRLN